MLCITHDLDETLAFDRVLVVEDGQVVEDGDPSQLLGDESSRFRAMFHAERAVRRRLGARNGWRRLRLEDGRVVEPREHEPATEHASPSIAGPGVAAPGIAASAQPPVTGSWLPTVRMPLSSIPAAPTETKQ